MAVIIFFSARLSKRTTEKKKKFSNRTFLGRLGNLGTRLGFMELVPYGAVLGVVVLLVVKEPHMSGTILIMVGARRCCSPRASTSPGSSPVSALLAG